MAEKDEVNLVKKKQNEKVKQTIEEMELTSDLFFSVVLEDVEVCQEVVSIIVGKEIRVLGVQYQHTILNLTHHSVRIDIMAEDMDGQKIGVEMHPQSNENRVRRTRYNIASMDVKTFETGEEYVDLPDAMHIYITKSDFLKTGKGVNLIERKVVGTNIEVCNGIHEYYVCLVNKGDTVAQTELFSYMRNSNGITSSVYFPKLVKKVNCLKAGMGGEKIMCEIMDKILAESVEEIIGILMSEKEGEFASMMSEKEGEFASMMSEKEGEFASIMSEKEGEFVSIISEKEAEFENEIVKKENDGKILGMVDFMRDLKYLELDIEQKIIEKYDLSQEQAKEYISL